MPEPGIKRFTLLNADNVGSVPGEIIETVGVGSSVDVMVDHSGEAHFLISEIFFQTEEGIRVEIMDEHREDRRFAVRITNEGTDEDEYYFDPYHLDYYGAYALVRVTFERTGWLKPTSP